MAGKVNRKG